MPMGPERFWEHPPSWPFLRPLVMFAGFFSTGNGDSERQFFAVQRGLMEWAVWGGIGSLGGRKTKRKPKGYEFFVLGLCPVVLGGFLINVS